VRKTSYYTWCASYLKLEYRQRKDDAWIFDHA